jgi:hypothetical protein
LNNLKKIATHERFVEGFAIVHLEEFFKIDMDLFGSAIVLPWDTHHDHNSPILCVIQVQCMQVMHMCWKFFQPLFADQRPPMTNLGLGATTALGNLSSLEAIMSLTLIFHSAAHLFASSKLCCYTREGTFSDNTLRGGID